MSGLRAKFKNLWLNLARPRPRAPAAVEAPGPYPAYGPLNYHRFVGELPEDPAPADKNAGTYPWLPFPWLREDPGPAESIPPSPETAGRQVCGFGGQSGWLAFASGGQGEVAKALGLRDPAWVDWLEGVELSYKCDSEAEGAFWAVFPPVQGWILASSCGILTLEFPNPLCPWFRKNFHRSLARLSRTFGEVQMFATYSQCGLYAWGRWVNGEGRRLVSAVGAEISQCGLGPDPLESRILAAAGIGEDEVLAVAAEWSLSPVAFDERTPGLAEPPLVLLGWLPLGNQGM